MTVVAFANGSQTATLTTEHFLSSPNVNGRFRLYVDLSNMVKGDYLELRVYKMVLTGGTQRVLDLQTLQDAQPADALIAQFSDVMNELTDTNAVRYSLKQTLGAAGRVFAWAVLKEETVTPTTAARTLDVSAAGEAGVDWANIGSPTTTVDLSGTTIKTSQVVASVTGAVGSVTGAVGSVTGAVGSVTAGVTLAASAVQAIWDALTSALLTAGSIGKLLVDNINATISSRLASASISLSGGAVTVGTNNDKTGYGLSAAAVQAIWDALTSALTTVGSIGKLLVTNIDAAISSRLASAGYTAPDNTSITAIKAKTDNLPSDPADASDVASAFSTVNATLATIASYIDTEVAAIKAKTDNLPASPAAVGSAMILTSGERNSVADALLDRADAIETGWTVRKGFRIIAAALGGKLSGAATTTIVIRDVADAKDRITATVDSDGNRTAITLDGS